MGPMRCCIFGRCGLSTTAGCGRTSLLFVTVVQADTGSVLPPSIFDPIL